MIEQFCFFEIIDYRLLTQIDGQELGFNIIFYKNFSSEVLFKNELEQSL